jgi:hypothetical protein
VDEGVSRVVLPGQLQLELDVLEVPEEPLDLPLKLRHLRAFGLFLRQEIQELRRVGGLFVQLVPFLDRGRQGRAALKGSLRRIRVVPKTCPADGLIEFFNLPLFARQVKDDLGRFRGAWRCPPDCS